MVSEVFEIAENILKAHHGATFIKVDLHIHTPKSNDWDEHNSEPEFHSSKITPEQIVEKALAAKLTMIAVTDHNSVEWCENVIKAAAETSLTVLPGFELTARPGVHILALFPPNKKISELRTLLIKLGIKDTDFGNASAMTDDTIENISSDFKLIRMIQDAGGLAIPAHIDIDSGIVGRLKGGPAVREFFDKSGCEIVEVRNAIPAVILDALRANPSKYAVIKSSDAHRLDEIGRNAIWVKMDMPSLHGLAQIAFEPLNRIQLSEPLITNKAKIIGMYSNGGHLSEQVYAFNEDLNCIIGGRGAGKSVIIDYLRFVFGNEPLDDELQSKFRKRLVDLVRDQTTVYVLASTQEGELWLYEKTLTYTSSKRGNRTNFEITSPEATVYQIILNQKRAVKFEDSRPSFRIEFYGQGEVQSITNTTEPIRQLRLIDNFVKSSVSQREAKILGLEHALTAIEKNITDNHDKLDLIATDIDQLEPLKKRVAEIENDFQDNRLKNHQIWEEADNWVHKAKAHVEGQIKKLDSLKFESADEKTFSIPHDGGQAALTKFLTQVNLTLQKLKETELAMQKDSETAWATLGSLLTDWENEYKIELDSHIAFLRTQGVENMTALSKELADKRAQCDRIEKELKPQKATLLESLVQLMTDRKQKLEELFKYREEMRDCRIQAAKRMTEKLSDVVVRIIDERDLKDYLDSLMASAPSGTRTDQLQKVIEKLQPHGLVKILRDKDIARLREITGVTENIADRLMQIGKSELMKLERVYCNDIATIRLMLEGNEKLLSDLSDGEKCTAILSVILLDETSPLIIDQPEDELDHAFVMSNVVDTLAKVKQKYKPTDSSFIPQKGRQFIIATHNQNVPVLGDAELVFKMHKISGQHRCEYESAAGLEHPDTIRHILGLEGGPDAFERRRRKYHASNN